MVLVNIVKHTTVEITKIEILSLIKDSILRALIATETEPMNPATILASLIAVPDAKPNAMTCMFCNLFILAIALVSCGS